MPINSPLPQAAVRPEVSVAAIGREAQPLATVEGFAPDPDRLRAAAIAGQWESAGQHYPGIRAPLPPGWLASQMPLIGSVIARAFGRYRRVEVVDASFSIVTTPIEALSTKQRLPHVDAFGAERIALVHYLSPEGGDGTAFFRHRSTGFETVDEGRAPAYFDRLDAELREHVPPPRYIAGDTALFERTVLAEARYNRALIYRSFLLHSGAIAADSALSPDPARGRLTVTAFLSVS